MKSKELAAWQQGAAWALELAKAQGVEGLEKELKWRGAAKVNITAGDKKRVEEFVADAKHKCILTILCMTCMVLHDEFGFSKVRLNRFIDRFNLKAAVLTDDLATWDDYQAILKEECDIDVDLPSGVAGRAE